MKEQYQAFATAALLLLAATSLTNSRIFLGNDNLTYGFSLLIFLLALGLLLRGIYCLFPVPLLGDERFRFEQAHPEVMLLTRDERILTYLQWRESRQNVPAASDNLKV